MLLMMSYFKAHWGGVGKGERDSWHRVYVVGKDMRERRAYVARGRGHPALFCDTAALRYPHWIGGDPPPQLASGNPLRCQYKARCGHCLSHLLSCKLSQRSWSPSLSGSRHRCLTMLRRHRAHLQASNWSMLRVQQVLASNSTNIPHRRQQRSVSSRAYVSCTMRRYPLGNMRVPVCLRRRA